MNRGLLVVFGDVTTQSGAKLGSDAIFRSLTSNGVWFSPRIPKGTVPGLPILLYQKGKGFRGSAILGNIGRTVNADARLCPGLPVAAYPYKLMLDKVQCFETPVQIQPLVLELDFISSKTYWGHALRFSPRLISLSDIQKIMKRSSVHVAASPPRAPGP